jgi:hypothetical protein
VSDACSAIVNATEGGEHFLGFPQIVLEMCEPEQSRIQSVRYPSVASHAEELAGDALNRSLSVRKSLTKIPTESYALGRVTLLDPSLNLFPKLLCAILRGQRQCFSC